MRFLRSFLLMLLTSTPAFAGDFYGFFDSNFAVKHEGTEIQVGVLSNPAAKGTVVYMPGYADTIANHEELLKGLRAQGMQVIAFDYPEHGQSGGSIRWWGLKSLAEIIPTVLGDARSGFDASLPLVLAGWSTGGTIAIRVAQAWQHVLPRGVRLSGVLAYSPAIPAQVVINVKKEMVTDGVMLHSPKPTTVPVVGAFATSITVDSRLAFFDSMPENISTLILFAGERDNYAVSRGTKIWVKRHGDNVLAFQCAGGMHGFEFEAGYGAEAKTLALGFAGTLLREGKVSFQGNGGKLCPRVSK